MKQIQILLLVTLTMSLWSCKDKKPTEGTVNVFFNNLANGQKIALAQEPSYTNLLGEKFNIARLKYYVNNIRLVDANGNTKALNEYHLIRETDFNAKREITIPSVPNGNYSKIIFNVGVDSALNKGENTNTGDLDALNGMFWSWTGYIFIAHEGSFYENTGAEKGLTYHVGGNNNYIKDITIPLNGLTVSGNTKKLTVNFEVASMYDGVNFMENPVVMGDNPGEDKLLGMVSDNVKAKCFTFGKVE